MDSVTDPASAALLRSADTLGTALHLKQQQTVSTTVLSLRRDLQAISKDAAQNARLRSRLTHLGESLRQIDRAAREGDFADAHRVLALLTTASSTRTP